MELFGSNFVLVYLVIMEMKIPDYEQRVLDDWAHKEELFDWSHWSEVKCENLY